MSDQRPDYVPKLWTQGPISVGADHSATRVFWSLLFLAVVPTVGGLALLLSHGRIRELGFVLAVIGVLSIPQAMVYVPRAYRAMREPRI